MTLSFSLSTKKRKEISTCHKEFEVEQQHVGHTK